MSHDHSIPWSMEMLDWPKETFGLSEIVAEALLTPKASASGSKT